MTDYHITVKRAGNAARAETTYYAEGNACQSTMVAHLNLFPGSTDEIGEKVHEEALRLMNETFPNAKTLQIRLKI